MKSSCFSKCLGAVLLVAGGLAPTLAHAQSEPPTERKHEKAGWLGIMTDTQLSGPWSVWFDTHYNTRAFVVLRGGLTYSFPSAVRLTGGYAHLWTDPGNGTLSRQEHRPWAQLFFPLRFSERWSLSQRIRAELRVREAISGGEVQNDWIVVPRLRSQTAVSYWFHPSFYGQWFMQSALEVLVNGGKHAGPNFLDQSRVSLMLGMRTGPVTARVGYLDRFIPGSAGTLPVHEHNMVLWLNYAFKRKKDKTPPHSPEIGN